MEQIVIQPTVTLRPWWRILGYALAIAATAWILASSSCEDDEAEKVGGKIPRGQRFSSVQQYE